MPYIIHCAANIDYYGVGVKDGKVVKDAKIIMDGDVFGAVQPFPCK